MTKESKSNIDFIHTLYGRFINLGLHLSTLISNLVLYKLRVKRSLFLVGYISLSVLVSNNRNSNYSTRITVANSVLYLLLLLLPLPMLLPLY